MIDISKFSKGGLLKPLSIRDFRFELAGAVKLPPSFEIPFGGKIKNQDGSSSCVSQATSYYAEVLNHIETNEWTELSPKFLYAQCFVSPGGSYVKDNMSLMTNEGIAPEVDLPSYEANLAPPSEAFMEKVSDITQEIKDEATPYIAKSYMTWNNTNIDLYKQAIMQGNGCVVITWGNDQCFQEAQIELPAFKEQLNWLHGIYLIGWNDATKNFTFLNSWGTEWGQNGYGYLPYDYATLGYVGNPYTMIDAKNTYFISLLSIIVNLQQKIIQLLKLKK